MVVIVFVCFVGVSGLDCLVWFGSVVVVYFCLVFVFVVFFCWYVVYC